MEIKKNTISKGKYMQDCFVFEKYYYICVEVRSLVLAISNTVKISLRRENSISMRRTKKIYTSFKQFGNK